MKCAAAILVWPLILFARCAFGSPSGQNQDAQQRCRAYVSVIEQDQITVNVQMSGMNAEQASWYKKHHQDSKYAEVCFLDLDPNHKMAQVALQRAVAADNSPATIGGVPIYVLAWEEHSVFVPDQRGGHYAWSANGVLSELNQKTDEPEVIGPVHSKNRTIFTSSSTSLLKAAVVQIQKLIAGKTSSAQARQLP
jgi:hypothetical protein